MTRLAALPALALLLVPLAAPAQDRAVMLERLPGPILFTPERLVWGPAPASLPEGAEIALIEGDLSKPEEHVFRIRIPDGWEIAPHSHPMREHITVLKGTFMMGTGDTVDRDKAVPMPTGSVYVLPVGAHHYAWAEGETVPQPHGIGPWGIDYVNPEDDPRTQ